MPRRGQPQTEFQRQRTREINFKHGYTSGGRKRPEYKIWQAMIRRCVNPKDTSFDRYGARGISVCDRWRYGEPHNGLSAFECFIADMGDRPERNLTIERLDNGGNYEPSNCTWVTRSVQGRNKRSTRMVEWEGERVPLISLCERLGLNPNMVSQRLEKLGWSLEKALTTPCTDPRNTEQARPSKFKPTLLVDWQGAQVPFIRLCEEHGIPYRCAIQRLRKLGWSIEKILQTPVS